MDLCFTSMCIIVERLFVRDVGVLLEACCCFLRNSDLERENEASSPESLRGVVTITMAKIASPFHMMCTRFLLVLSELDEVRSMRNI